MYQIVPQHFVTVSDQSSRKKTKEKHNPEGDIRFRKRGHSDGDKEKTRTKRTFKNQIIRSNRLSRVAEASTEIPTAIPTNTSRSNCDCTLIRNIRSSHGSYHHVSLASKRKDKKNKKDRKENVITALSLILGSEDESPVVSDDDDNSAWKIKSTCNSATAAADDVEFTTNRKRRTQLPDSQAPKRRDGENKKDRKESVMGSLYTILGPIDGDYVDTSSTSKKIGIYPADYGYFPISRKRPTILPIPQASKPKNRNRHSLKEKVSGSRPSMLGLEKPSPVASYDSARLVSGSRTVHNNAASSPRKKRSAIDDFNRTQERKHEQRPIRDKYKSIKKTNRSFNEDEARKLIRAKLSKNQRKYDTLAAALASTKAKATSKLTNPSISTSELFSESSSNKPKSTQVSSSVSKSALSPESTPTKAKSTDNQVSSSVSTSALSPESTSTIAMSTENQASSSVSTSAMSPKSTEVMMPTIKNNFTGKHPKIRSRARNGRLYSVCKRIPPSIPEDGILEMDSSGNTRKSTPILSFPPRCSSPRITPKCAVKQQIMSHSTKIVTSCRGNDKGGISFNNNEVDKLEQARQMKVRHQRNKKQMFNRWLSDQH